MALTYAVIESSIVTNVVRWDGLSIWAPENPSAVVVDITSLDPQPGIGWTYDGTDFTAPAPTPEEPAILTELPATFTVYLENTFN